MEKHHPDEEPDKIRDELYQVLANADRRRVLRYLTTHREWVPVNRLIAELVTSESADEDSSAGHSALVSLHHMHLPKLREAGLIEWDREGRKVLGTLLLNELPWVLSDGVSGFSGKTPSKRQA